MIHHATVVAEVGRIELYIVPLTIISSKLELSEDDTDSDSNALPSAFQQGHLLFFFQDQLGTDRLHVGDSGISERFEGHTGLAGRLPCRARGCCSIRCRPL
jgi:hypothetical protein